MIQKNYYLLFINLGAIDIENEDVKFNQYFEPTCHISWSSSQVTGLTVNGLDLCLNGEVIKDVLPSDEAIDSFILWLQAHFPNGCILVAHNGKRFDFPIFKRYLKQSTKTFGEPFYGIDSREIFKAHFPHLGKIKMQNLVEEFLPNNSCRYHDAFEDAKNLGAIIGEACKKKEISIREFLQVKHKNLYLLE